MRNEEIVLCYLSTIFYMEYYCTFSSLVNVMPKGQAQIKTPSRPTADGLDPYIHLYISFTTYLPTSSLNYHISFAIGAKEQEWRKVIGMCSISEVFSITHLHLVDFLPNEKEIKKILHIPSSFGEFFRDIRMYSTVPAYVHTSSPRLASPRESTRRGGFVLDHPIPFILFCPIIRIRLRLPLPLYIPTYPPTYVSSTMYIVSHMCMLCTVLHIYVHVQ